jgi:hypothetical protein
MYMKYTYTFINNYKCQYCAGFYFVRKG